MPSEAGLLFGVSSANASGWGKASCSRARTAIGKQQSRKSEARRGIRLTDGGARLEHQNGKPTAQHSFGLRLLRSHHPRHDPAWPQALARLGGGGDQQRRCLRDRRPHRTIRLRSSEPLVHCALHQQPRPLAPPVNSFLLEHWQQNSRLALGAKREFVISRVARKPSPQFSVMRVGAWFDETGNAVPDRSTALALSMVPAGILEARLALTCTF